MRSMFRTSTSGSRLDEIQMGRAEKHDRLTNDTAYRAEATAITQIRIGYGNQVGKGITRVEFNLLYRCE